MRIVVVVIGHYEYRPPHLHHKIIKIVCESSLSDCGGSIVDYSCFSLQKWWGQSPYLDCISVRDNVPVKEAHDFENLASHHQTHAQ